MATTTDLWNQSVPEEHLSFRVLVDGVPYLETTLERRMQGAGAWHEIELPEAGSAAAELTFEVDGYIYALPIGGIVV